MNAINTCFRCGSSNCQQWHGIEEEHCSFFGLRFLRGEHKICHKCYLSWYQAKNEVFFLTFQPQSSFVSCSPKKIFEKRIENNLLNTKIHYNSFKSLVITVNHLQITTLRFPALFEAVRRRTAQEGHKR